MWYVDGGAHTFLIKPLHTTILQGKRAAMNRGSVLHVLFAIPTSCMEVGRIVHYNWIVKRIILLLFGTVIRANHYTKILQNLSN